MSKERKPKNARGLFLRRFSVWVLALWFLCMCLLTLVAGQMYYNSLLYAADHFSERVFYYPNLGDLYDKDAEDDHLPGFAENRLLMACDYGNDCWASPSVTHHRWSFLSDSGHMTQTAVVIADYDGQTYYTNGNYYFFSCATEEEWIASKELYGETTRYVWTRFDPAAFTDAGKIAFEKEPHAHFWHLRLTGVLEGNELIPDKIEMRDYSEYNNGDAFYREMRSGTTNWTTLYLRETPQTSEPVVLYTTGTVDVSIYDPGKPVRFLGQTYDSLQAMTQQMLREYFSQPDPYKDFTMRDYSLLRFVSMESFHMSDTEIGPDGLLQHEPLYCVTSALYASPLLMAMYSLRWVYVGTLALALLIVRHMDKLFRKKFLRPLQTVNEGIKGGWNNIWGLREEKLLAETSQLLDNYAATKSTLVENTNERNRLQKALDFAKEAEENRRQMTSAIAHELKTPLAVIHSYTEGLQERINEEKREQYLQVILSEVQRLDGMVLEMLDLSRLEAGKVKLARDQFSLCDLTRATFERLSLAVEAKELQVEYLFRCDGMVIADEARIGQVLTNFISNAVKYARFGGQILVTVETVEHQTRFRIENDCDPLPREALSRIWDTFYRADTARSGEGTGLGLAICKNIIELHGGKVSAFNTQRGVEFRFRI